VPGFGKALARTCACFAAQGPVVFRPRWKPLERRALRRELARGEPLVVRVRRDPQVFRGERALRRRKESVSLESASVGVLYWAMYVQTVTS
jgi:hypothetical protein